MIEIFETEPTNIHENVLIKWKELGPIDLQELINIKKIKFNEKIDIV
jgi:hypothetical protein